MAQECQHGKNIYSYCEACEDIMYRDDSTVWQVNKKLMAESEKLKEQFRALAFINARAIDLINYFEENANSPEEKENCISILKEFDEYVDEFICRKTRENNE